MALHSIGCRIRHSTPRSPRLTSPADALVLHAAPTLVSRTGVGAVTTSQLLVTAGQNNDRLSGNTDFVRLCGVAPLPSPHPGGDRQANWTQHLICVCRMHYDQRTKDHIVHRTAEGLSAKDAMRCVNRYVARRQGPWHL